MGGSVVVDNVLGHGSTFTISFKVMCLVRDDKTPNQNNQLK